MLWFFALWPPRSFFHPAGVRASKRPISPNRPWSVPGSPRKRGDSDHVFNADGTGYLQRGEIIEKITFADKGDGTFEMSTEHAKTPITEGYRIEGDTLYTYDLKLGFEDAYTRKQ